MTARGKISLPLSGGNRGSSPTGRLHHRRPRGGTGGGEPHPRLRRGGAAKGIQPYAADYNTTV